MAGFLKSLFASKLCDACENGDLEAVVKAIKGGSNLNKKDKFDRTPLMIATTAGRRDIVQLLVDAGADIHLLNDNGKSAIHLARAKPLLEVLINAGADVNQQTSRHCTALHYAVKQYSPKITQLLLDYGAQVDARDKSGQTPLHVAIGCGNWDHVILLLTHGADCNIYPLDSSQRTPLHMVTQQRLTAKFVHTLLVFGYDLWTDVWYQRGENLPACITEDGEMHTLLQSFLLVRPTLKELCRTSIRKRLSQSTEPNSFLVRTLELPLPRPMVNYITYERELQDLVGASDWDLFKYLYQY